MDNEGLLEEKTIYKFGYIEQNFSYYKNGNIKQQTDYSIHHEIDKITYYNKNKTIKGELLFKDGVCYNGYLYNDLEENDSYILYKDGEFVEIKQIDENNVLRYYKEKQKNGQMKAEIYNEKGEKSYIYTITRAKNDNSEEEDLIIDFVQYENGKEINKGVIKNKILQQGSIKIKNKWDDNMQHFYKVKDKKIVLDYVINGKILKTVLLDINFTSFGNNYLNYAEEFFITEDNFDPFIPSYNFDTENNTIMQY